MLLEQKEEVLQVVLRGPALLQHLFPTGPVHVDAGEDAVGWYRRSSDVMRRIMRRHSETSAADLLVVAHGLSHDALTYGLCNPGAGGVPPVWSKW